MWTPQSDNNHVLGGNLGTMAPQSGGWSSEAGIPGGGVSRGWRKAIPEAEALALDRSVWGAPGKPDRADANSGRQPHTTARFGFGSQNTIKQCLLYSGWG